MPKVTSIRLPDELTKRLDAVARAMDRPRSWVIRQAIASYVREQEARASGALPGLDGHDPAGTRIPIAHQRVIDALEHMIAEAAADDADAGSSATPPDAV